LIIVQELVDLALELRLAHVLVVAQALAELGGLEVELGKPGEGILQGFLRPRELLSPSLKVLLQVSDLVRSAGDFDVEAVHLSRVQLVQLLYLGLVLARGGLAFAFLSMREVFLPLWSAA
jgi:hypothetical protein